MPEEIKYKPSKYNFFFDSKDGTHLAFNAVSGGFVKIKDENYKEAIKIIKTPKRYDKINCDRSLWDASVKNRFIIPSTMDEIKVLELRNYLAKYSDATLSLTIAPTLNCNFKCPYCYEVPNKNRITDEKSNSIINLINNEVQKLKRLHIVWFGGEPLLCADIIYKLGLKIKYICNRNNCIYGASITTNGFLLTKRIAENLKETNVNFVQITVDGPENIHDQRRILTGGGKTYKTIIDNIKNAIDIIPQIAVRINVDKQNVNYIDELLASLIKEDLHKGIYLSFEATSAESAACQTYSQHVFNDREFSSIIIDLWNKAIDQGFWLSEIPLTVSNYCGMVPLKSYVMDYDCDLYKCYADVGIKQLSVGKITDSGEINLEIEKLAKWMGIDPFKRKECIKCKVLPLCMGGCIYNEWKGSKNKKCKYYRWNLENMLRIVYQFKNKNLFPNKEGR